MTKEFNLFIRLLEDEMLDINALLIKNYKKLNINEKDIIVLSSLARQDYKGNRMFQKIALKKKVALETNDFNACLYNLCEKGYLEITDTVNPKTGKECEEFSLKKLYLAIIDLYIDKPDKKNDENLSMQEKITKFYDEHYNKQMSPLDADIIRNWCSEKQFSFEEIKNEMLDAIKMGKMSLKSVDQALIKKKTIQEQSPEYIETNKVISELKDKWKK